MAQTGLFVDALKRVLKQRGLTYADVARHLGLSQASVKRLFSDQSLSLERLDRICELAQIQLVDLARLVEERASQVKLLSEAQERELIADPRRFLVFYLALNDYSLEDICRDYRIEPLEGVRLLAQLDRAGLIELLPGNRIKLKVSRQLEWRVDGPIRRFFEQRVRQEFLHSRFDQPGESLKFVSGVLSEASLAVLQRRLELLAHDFNELVKADAQLPLDQRHGCSLLLAQRRWEFSLFRELRRAR